MMRRSLWLSFFAALAVGLCLAGAAVLRQSAPPPAADKVPVPTASLADVMRRAHFSFREENGAFNGGHSTYASRVQRGQVELTAAGAQASPFRLGATRVQRGARRLSTGDGTPHRNADGTLSLDLGQLEEQLENGPEGLEQRWRFEAAPVGEGDLVVRVPVEATYQGAGPEGLRFSVGALAYRYSHATWVDAKGTRTAVTARWAEGAVELKVPASVLQQTDWPAVLDPLVSAEIALDPNVVGAAPLNQDTPAVAWNGSEYLAVWIDGRGPGGVNRDIYGARVSAGGAVLDPTGILISVVAISAQEPAVASNGTDFMVVWSQSDSTLNFIAAARVTAAGVALDATGATVAYAGGTISAITPAIAWSGTSYLVVWGEDDMGTAAAIDGVRIDQSHTTLGSPFAISTSGACLAPDIDWDGSNFLVVWNQIGGTTGGIAGARVSALGVKSAPFTISGTGAPGMPTVAWNGATHLVAWQEVRTSTLDIFGARVPASGTTITDPAGFVVSNAANDQSQPDLTAAGATFYVSWQDSRSGTPDIYGAQVSGSTVTPAAGTAISSAASNQQYPAVTSDGTNVLAVWTDYRSPSGTSDIYGTLLNGAGAVQTPAGTLVSTAPNPELTPAVAYDGTNYLVVWEDQRGATSDIYGVRVSKAGVPVDAAAFVISNAANTQKAPAVTWMGSTYLVVWQDDRTTAGNFDIYGARVTAAATVTDATGFAINTQANSQQLPAVASDGTNALVVWQDDRVIATSDHVFGTRVSAAAAVLDGTGLAISAGSNRERRPTVAFNGTTYFVAWENLVTYWEIYGRTVSTAMALGTRTPYATAIGPTFYQRFHPALGATAGTFLLAWESNTLTDVDIIGDRLDSSGLLVGVQLTLATGSQVQSYPAVAGDGTNFQVVWQDASSGSANRNLYGRRVVAGTGALLDGTGLAISTNIGDEVAPALASSGSRAFLVAYQAFALGPNAIRARARTLSNTPPTATAASSMTNEDTPLPIVLTGADADGDTLTYAIVTGPTHGSLSGTPPNVTYTPAPNYNGPDSFTFKVNDTVVDSAPATFSLTVNPVNDLPVPNSQSASVQEDTPTGITLTGSDIESSPLTYTVVNQPTHGSLSGAAPNVTYSPFLNYFGPDSFTFKVNDGTADSATLATVTITVVAVNDPPTGTLQNLTTPEDTALGITLTGTDIEGSPLTFAVVTQPPFGTLSGAPPNLTYTPNLNFNGTDSFFFKANDGTADSPPAQVSIIVTPVNDAPVAQSQNPGGPQDVVLPITLSASDVDNNPLSYIIVTQPTHGTLSAGTSAARTYNPNPGYQGPDVFTFKVNDGTVDSNVATVTINISSVNHAPTATPQSLTIPEDTAMPITLAGTDIDGNTLSYTVTVPPLHGSLTGSGSTRSYTPNSNYNGADSFTFIVNDGQQDSSPAVVSITVSPVNDAPIAQAQNVNTQEDTPVPIVLSGSDVDGNALTFTVTAQPLKGTLSGTSPNLTYTPLANANGFDTISFKANDGTVDSAMPANVQILIAPVNDAPVALAQMVMTDQDTAKFITLAATDVDGDFLIYSVVTQPSHGMVQGTPPNVTYVPAAGYRGGDSFSFKATDGQQDSAPATVTIAVAVVLHPPVVMAQTVTLDEDTDAGLTVVATDPDGDPLTFAVVAAPTHGTLTGSGPQFNYTPNPNFNGPDFFTVKANDGTLDSIVPGRIDLTVKPVNDPPVATMQEVTSTEDAPVTIVLAGTDLDGDPLTYRLVDSPAHGSLSGNPPNVTYTPGANENGDDRFTFVVNDGTLDSAPAGVTVHVQPVNDAPVAQSLSFSTGPDTPVEVTLQGSDVDNDGLTFQVKDGPAHGTLEGTPPDLTYVPNSGSSGPDEFKYVVNDGTVDSAPATVTVTVGAGNQGVPKQTYARVNGWTCGCGQGGAGPGLVGLVWLLFLRRRRLPRAAAVALSVLVFAASAWAKPAAKKKPDPAPPPAAVIEAPAPAPAAVEPAPAPPAVAQPPAPAGLPTLAALEVAVTVPNEKLDNSAFTEMLVSAIDQGKLFKVISASEVATLLGVERQRQLLGCGEDSCLAEISGALGSQYLLQGAVGKVGENYLVTVRLLDARRGVVVGRAAQQTTDMGQLLGLVWRGTQEVVDAAARDLPADERERWLARPREEPAATTAAPKARLGLAVTAVGGYQPVADPGLKASFGGEVDVTLRISRIDLGLGVVVSPSPGGRVTATFALLATRSRVGVGVRGVYFPGARLGGGGVVGTYEFALNSTFGVRALLAAEVYGGAPSVVLALLGGVGVEAHF